MPSFRFEQVPVPMKQQESVFTAGSKAFTAEQALTVGQLNRMAGRVLQDTFGVVKVVGELSNFTRAASGHWYFTLKDAGAAVRAVMFRSAAARVDFRPREGDQVEVLARVSLYEARGDFQLGVERMQLAGAGDVWQRFARLKALLQAEGLFDAGRKQLLPPDIHTVGIVSSLKAAALQDVLTTLRRRAPQLRVIIYPAAVQGQQAPAELIAAIGAAESRQECDVLLVVRGGGSFEDLDAFNHEGLVRRLAGCSLPVVSGVGHESDFTLTDFVADVRAPTPTAAAELVSPDRRQALQQLAYRGHRLATAMQRQLERLAQRLDMAERLLRSPGQRLQARHQRLAQLAGRLSQAMTRLLPSPQQRLERQAERLQRSMVACLAASRNRLQRGETLLRAPQTGPAAFRLQRAEERLAQAAGLNWQRAAQRLDRAETSLGLISPLAVLGRGYAIVRDGEGRLLASAADAATGQSLDVQLRDGRLAVTVDAVRPA